MARSSLFYGIVCSLALASACNKAADEEQSAIKAQNEATNKITQATQEANQKIATAQAEADKKIADAQANFLKMREDYRHKKTQDLVELDRKVADLEAKVKTEKAKAKAELDARLTKIRADRAAFEKDFKDLEAATAATWDDAKLRLDKEWDELKKVVEGN